MPPDAPDAFDLGATMRGYVPGQKVFGRYVLEDIAGRGGMGVVWRGHDQTLGEKVALKFLPDGVARDGEAMADLKHETARCHQLTHPHIVRVHDFVQDQHDAAIVMEFVAGPSLAQRKLTQPQACFTPAEVFPWIEQIAAALDYAHTTAKVVHRDLKPGNVLIVEATGTAKITDFGIARSLSDTRTRLTAQGPTSGTLPYMSPQQILGHPSAPSDDLYALGAMIFELLTGKPPFTSGDIGLQVREVTPPLVSARRRERGLDGSVIPAEWDKAIAACLAKQPESRPRTAAQLVRVLTSAPGLAAAAGRESWQEAATRVAVLPVPSSGAGGTKDVSRGPLRGWLFVGALVLGAALAYGLWQRKPRSLAAEPARQPASEPATDHPKASEPTKSPAANDAPPPRPEEKSPASPRPGPSSGTNSGAAAGPGNATAGSSASRGNPPVQASDPPRAEPVVAPKPPLPSGARRIAELDLDLLPVSAGPVRLAEAGALPASSGASSFWTQPAEARVTQPFWLGRTEMTRRQWIELRSPGGLVTGDGDLPAVSISYDEIVAALAELNRRHPASGAPAGYVYRLPTELEWLRALQTDRPSGWFTATVREREVWDLSSARRRIQAAGTQAASPGGFHDLLGNAAEWCLDGGLAQAAAPVGDDFVALLPGDRRVVRGGSANDDLSRGGPAWCATLPPGERSPTISFRVALAPALAATAAGR